MKLLTAAQILYAEDNDALRLAVKQMLEQEGARVDACADGLSARVKLESREHYDVLLFDDELPGISGLSLTRRAGELRHRQRTPVIVISVNEVEAAARMEGADAFVKKGEEVGALVVERLARLLGVSSKG